MPQMPVQGGHQSMEVSIASTVINPKVRMVPSAVAEYVSRWALARCSCCP
jgi:hypothetical protein